MLKVSTGPSHKTQASLLRPPRCMETTWPSASATRTRPPGIAIQPEAGVQNIRAQHQAARVQAPLVPNRRGRKSHLFLRHVFVGTGTYLLADSLLFRLRKTCAEDGLHSAQRERGFDHDAIQMVQHPIQRVILAAPPGRHGRQFERLAQQLPRQAGQKRHDGGGLDHAAPQRVGHDHVAGM